MSKETCLYCGANPTPHGVSWFSESFTVVLAPLNRLASAGRVSELILRLVVYLFTPAIWLLEKLGVLRYNNAPSKTTGPRGKVLWEEALRRGIPMQSIALFGKELDHYRATVQGKTFFFTGLPRPTFGASGAEWWMDDKAKLKQKFIAAGIPAARGGSFSRFEPMLKLFQTLEKPVIIKPRLGSRGRHTTTHIYTEEQLAKAFAIAKQLCYWIVMEEHLVGSVYRGTIIDGKLAGVLGGDPPRVTGDGLHTIEELIAIKNTNKDERIKEVKITPVMLEFLTRTGRSLTTILPAGERVDLLEKIGISYGGSSAEVTDITHPETKKILEQAAAVVGDPILGFDFIIEHIDRSPHEQKWGLIECNGVPFINLHHDPIEGKSNNVAKHVWDFVEKDITPFV